jgi:arginase family enzyme
MKLLQVPCSQRLFSSSFSGVRKIHVDKPKDFIGLIGICDDRNSSYLKGTKLAPPKIRELLQCDSSNSFSELKIEIPSYIYDYGDYHPGQNFPDISKIIANMCDEDRIPLTLGGDHSITAPVFTAVRKAVGEPITIIHFDAHPDLYPLFQDNVHSHASPFARILEQENACRKLIQVGIRTVNDIQEAQISKYNVKAIEAKDFPAKGTDLLTEFRKHIPNNDSPVYISVDIDVLEPVSSHVFLHLSI